METSHKEHQVSEIGKLRETSRNDSSWSKLHKEISEMRTSVQ